MSVLIKGMEMPTLPKVMEQWGKVPYIDVRIFADGTAVTTKGERPYYTQYSVVSAPPHGRLIDADALEVHDGWLSEAEGYSTHITFVYSNAIDLAPTIIEAEVEE